MDVGVWAVNVHERNEVSILNLNGGIPEPLAHGMRLTCARCGRTVDKYGRHACLLRR